MKWNASAASSALDPASSPTSNPTCLIWCQPRGASRRLPFGFAETIWNHFQHYRRAFETHGLPEAIYTDGFSLFDPSSSTDYGDPKSQFQRALRGLGVAHIVAPTPQAKGKIEHRFGTFQHRFVTLLAHAKAKTYEHADEILQMEIIRQNRTQQRNSARIPLDVWDRAVLENNGQPRPTPVSSLLDLHFSMRGTRTFNNDQTIDFEGRNHEIASTTRKPVTIAHHPNLKFRVMDHPPKDVWPRILGTFGL